jgi:hypothetical protein
VRAGPRAALAAALWLCGRAAPASPALPGFTGVLTTPSAFSQAFQSGAAGFSVTRHRARAYVNYGAWETGEVALTAGSPPLRAHLKVTLRPETAHGPALAVGVTELLGSDASLYAVAGGNLRVRDSGARLRIAGGVATNGALPAVFTNVELRVSRVAVLAVEWARAINLGLRLDPTAEFRVLIGRVRGSGSFGLSYDIGF